MQARGLLGRVLLSHDAGWYHVGEPGGGPFRPYDTLMAQLVPALSAAGLTAEEVRQLTVDNPRAAFTIGIRRIR
jgi:phosphotriesterase-related protein